MERTSIAVDCEYREVCCIAQPLNHTSLCPIACLKRLLADVPRTRGKHAQTEIADSIAISLARQPLPDFPRLCFRSAPLLCTANAFRTFLFRRSNRTRKIDNVSDRVGAEQARGFLDLRNSFFGHA